SSSLAIGLLVTGAGLHLEGLLRPRLAAAARLGRSRPSRCNPAPVTSRPIASEELPSASATSCQIFGKGRWITLTSSPTAQAQISGFFTTVMAIARADCFSGEAKCASTATLNTLTIG